MEIRDLRAAGALDYVIEKAVQRMLGTGVYHEEQRTEPER